MTDKSHLLVIGVMTGNSLDGADVVLTRFDEDGSIRDLKAHNLESPPELAQRLRELRTLVNSRKGDMDAVSKDLIFEETHNEYIDFVAQAIGELIKIAKEDEELKSTYDLNDIDLIGFHGQTCAHFPPSIAKANDPSIVYTVQIGDGQMLADLTGITVVCDFRSDDLMNGNTGNFTIISTRSPGSAGGSPASNTNTEHNEPYIAGWDVGPFNNYPDQLVRDERGHSCDMDGQFGRWGQIKESLMRKLFETAVITNDRRNFLTLPPPKSSDPQWYKVIPELAGKAMLDQKTLTFEDRLRTAEYFAAYIFVFALTMIPEDVTVPHHFALSGGGWKNPISRNHFAGLLAGDFLNHPVLKEHKEIFEGFIKRLPEPAVIEFSDKYGFDGTAMEARIFADAAACRIKGEAFTQPNTTGATSDTICGIIHFPNKAESNGTFQLHKWLEKHQSRDLTKPLDHFDSRWSRASAGWSQRLTKDSKASPS